MKIIQLHSSFHKHTLINQDILKENIIACVDMCYVMTIKHHLIRLCLIPEVTGVPMSLNLAFKEIDQGRIQNADLFLNNAIYM